MQQSAFESNPNAVYVRTCIAPQFQCLIVAAKLHTDFLQYHCSVLFDLVQAFFAREIVSWNLSRNPRDDF